MVAGGTALKLAIKRYDWNDVARRYEILLPAAVGPHLRDQASVGSSPPHAAE